MKSLVTGYGGFVAEYLVKLLSENNYEIAVTVFPPMLNNTIKKQAKKQGVKIYSCDLTNEQNVKKLIKDFKPNEIYHLAAQSHVPTAWKNPTDTFKTNVFGTLNIFTAVLYNKISPRILVVGSSEEYGDCRDEDMPLKETSPLKPTNPYAASKVAQDFIAFQYAKTGGLDIVRVRPFSHTGPGQRSKFVCPNFTKQIAKIALGLKEPIIKVGNLKPKRDFLDVRDVVRAYYLALKKGKCGAVYNIASGKARSIESILKTCIKFSLKDIKIENDPSLFRPADIPVLKGDASLFKKTTGWKPLIPFDKTLQDLYCFWLEYLQLKDADPDF